MSTKTESNTQVVIYVGRRRFNDDVAHCFEGKKGKALYFKGTIKYLIVGHKYPSVDERMSRIPEDLGRADVPDEKVEEWRLLDVAADEYKKRTRAATRASNMDDVLWNKTLGELHGMLQKYTNFRDEKAFLERIEYLVSFGKGRTK